MESRFERFVKRVISALNESKIDYVIVGGVAAIIYGRPRTTMDIDIIADLNLLEEESIKRLTSILTRYDLDVTEKEIITALKNKSHFSIFDKITPFRVDMKSIYTKLDQIVIKNRRKITLLNLETWIEAPEDLIIAKLIYGSPQDIEDVFSVIVNIRDHLDMNYLTKRAKEENVYDMLMEIFRKI